MLAQRRVSRLQSLVETLGLRDSTPRTGHVVIVVVHDVIVVVAVPPTPMSFRHGRSP